jgi:uncharacterized membrane protein
MIIRALASAAAEGLMSDEAIAAERRTTINEVPVDRPWAWLAAGWRDLWAAPLLSFGYGAAIVLAGWLLVALALWADLLWVILPMTAGFFLVAPLLGAGLYEISRRRERGEPLGVAELMQGFRRNGTQVALMGVALLVLHLFWVRIASLIFAVSFGINFNPSLEQLPMAMVRSENFLPFLIVGTGFGFGLACTAFAISAVSIPMLVDRDVTVMEAITISLSACATNWRAMALWAGLIVVFVGLALVPFFAGLVLALPLIGHATWHAYRDLVR